MMGVIRTPAQGSPIPHVHEIAKRSNWASNQRGVILDFVIVFLVGCGILGLIVHREWVARKTEKAQWSVEEIKDHE